jgi:hypothetical protein
VCEKCDELDEKIAHVRRLSQPALDPLTLDNFAALVEYESEKKALHPGDRG